MKILIIFNYSFLISDKFTTSLWLSVRFAYTHTHTGESSEENDTVSAITFGIIKTIIKLIACSNVECRLMYIVNVVTDNGLF